jgi:predicted aspartyl protease
MSSRELIRAGFFVFWFTVLYPSLGFGGIYGDVGTTSVDTVYTFPFHMDNKLLVFEGEINGVPTQFAFDTGAGMGLADESFKTDGRFSGNAGKIKMRDSNQKVQKVKIAKSKLLKIGGFEFGGVKSLVVDMPFLTCMDYYLLGADVIRQLNWEIDFEKKLVSVSKSPFPLEEIGLSFPVDFIQHRPHVKLSFSGEEFDKVLVDFGYTQTLNFPMDFDEKSEFIERKESENKANPYLGFSMGALSMATNMTYAIILDSLQLGDSKLYGIPADFEENTSEKIGLKFFSTLSSRTILNNTEGVFHLALKAPRLEFDSPTHMNFTFQDGKIIVTGKPLGRIPEDSKIGVGEEILELNGMRADDFGDFCGFIVWLSQLKSEEIKVKKMDGTELIFGKTPLN